MGRGGQTPKDSGMTDSLPLQLGVAEREFTLADKNSKQVSVDMSDAVVFEAIPDRTPALVTCTVWDENAIGKNSGEPKVHAEVTVLEPEEFKGRKIFEDINLKNVNTKGRLIPILLATPDLGYKTDKDIKVPNFKLPTKAQMEGQQWAVSIRIQKGTGGYADSNRLSQFRPGGTWGQELAGDKDE